MRNRFSGWLHRYMYKHPSRVTGTLMVMAIAIAWFTLRAIAWGQCSWYGYETSRVTRYSPFIGCMIQTPNGWVPRNELRIVQ
jgi:hypothetical protein